MRRLVIGVMGLLAAWGWTVSAQNARMAELKTWAVHDESRPIRDFER